MKSYIYYFLFLITIGLLPIFIKNNYYMNLLIFIGIYSIVSMGSVILLGYAGQISLGQSAFYGIGAYTSALLTLKAGFPFWIGFLGAMIASMFVGILIGLVALRVKGNYLAMATASFSVLTMVLIRELRSVTGGIIGLPNIPTASVFAFYFNDDLKYFYLVWGVFIILFLFSKNFINSKVGRAMLALKHDEEASGIFGINVVKYKLKAFIISSCYSAIGGVLFAHYVQFIDSTSFHLTFSLTILFIITIGGLECLWGTVLGSSVILILPEIFKKLTTLTFLPDELKSLLQDYSYTLIVLSLITILILIFLPRGMSSLFIPRKLE